MRIATFIAFLSFFLCFRSETTSNTVKTPISNLNVKGQQEKGLSESKVQEKMTPFYCGQAVFNRNEPVEGKTRQLFVSTIFGFSMYVDSKDKSVSKKIAISGTWKSRQLNLIGHMLKPGDKVLDLGSQFGLITIAMAKIIGSTGRLFAFQPYSFSNELLVKNVKHNNLTNIITIFKKGAGDKKQKALIHVPYVNTGRSQIIMPSKSNSTTVPKGYDFQEEVELDRVDSLVSPGIKIDFAIVDVHMMEIKALKGMKEIMERSPNLILMVDWKYYSNPNKNVKQTMEVLRYMIKIGYRAYIIYGGDFSACTMGRFEQLVNIQSLLSLDFPSIFFLRKTHPLLQSNS